VITCSTKQEPGDHDKNHSDSDGEEHQQQYQQERQRDISHHLATSRRQRVLNHLDQVYTGRRWRRLELFVDNAVDDAFRQHTVELYGRAEIARGV
jgi:hypothetical protein